MNYIHWNVDPEILNIFGITLRYYSLLFLIGIFISVTILKEIFVKEGLKKDNVDKLTIYAVVGILLGARLGHCLFYDPIYYISNPLEVFLPIRVVSDGSIIFSGFQGLASHGGVIGIILGMLIYSKKNEQSFLETLDYISIVAPLGGSFIRLGNLMNSEIIGKPTTFPFAFVFERVDVIPRHPVQLYEAIAYLVIFTIVYMLYKKTNNKPGSGYYFGIAGLLVFLFRFIIEYFKEKQVDFEAGMFLDMGQILSIPFIIISLLFVFRSLKKKRNNINLKERGKL